MRQVFSITDSKNQLVGVAYVDADGKIRAGLAFVPREERDAVRNVIEWYSEVVARTEKDGLRPTAVNTITGHTITLTKAEGSYGACFLQNAS